jgi:hypothetical protein
MAGEILFQLNDRNVRMSYHEQMQKIFEQYEAEVSSEPADLKEVGSWAIAKGLWKPRAMDLAANFARDMAEALREQMRTDKAGRRYRAKIPAKSKTVDGMPLFKWADIDTAPRPHVERGLGYRRQSIVADCYQLRIDADHYNSVHPDEEPINPVLQFEDDVEELKIAKGIDDGEAA